MGGKLSNPYARRRINNARDLSFPKSSLVEAFSLLLGRDVLADQGKNRVLYSSGTMEPDTIFEMFEGRDCRLIWQFVEEDGRIVEEQPEDDDASWLVEVSTDGSLFDAMLVATRTWDAKCIKVIAESRATRLKDWGEPELEKEWMSILNTITDQMLRQHLGYLFVTEEEARSYGESSCPEMPLNDIPGYEYVMGWNSNEGTEELAIVKPKPPTKRKKSPKRTAKLGSSDTQSPLVTVMDHRNFKWSDVCKEQIRVLSEADHVKTLTLTDGVKTDALRKICKFLPTQIHLRTLKLMFHDKLIKLPLAVLVAEAIAASQISKLHIGIWSFTKESSRTFFEIALRSPHLEELEFMIRGSEDKSLAAALQHLSRSTVRSFVCQVDDPIPKSAKILGKVLTDSASLQKIRISGPLNSNMVSILTIDDVRAIANGAIAHANRVVELHHCALEDKALKCAASILASDKVRGIGLLPGGKYQSTYLNSLNRAAGLETLGVGFKPIAAGTLAEIITGNPIKNLELHIGEGKELKGLADAIAEKQELRRFSLGDEWSLGHDCHGFDLMSALGQAPNLEEVILNVESPCGVQQVLKAPLQRLVVGTLRWLAPKEADQFLELLESNSTLAELDITVPDGLPTSWHCKLGELCPPTTRLQYSCGQLECQVAFIDGVTRNGRLKEITVKGLCSSGELCASLVAMLDKTQLEACTLNSHFFDASCPGNVSFEGSEEILAALKRVPTLKEANLKIGNPATRIDLSASEWCI